MEQQRQERGNEEKDVIKGMERKKAVTNTEKRIKFTVISGVEYKSQPITNAWETRVWGEQKNTTWDKWKRDNIANRGTEVDRMELYRKKGDKTNDGKD